MAVTSSLASPLLPSHSQTLPTAGQPEGSRTNGSQACPSSPLTPPRTPPHWSKSQSPPRMLMFRKLCSLRFSLSLSLSHTHTRAHTHGHTRAVSSRGEDLCLSCSRLCPKSPARSLTQEAPTRQTNKEREAWDPPHRQGAAPRRKASLSQEQGVKERTYSSRVGRELSRSPDQVRGEAGREGHPGQGPHKCQGPEECSRNKRKAPWWG